MSKSDTLLGGTFGAVIALMTVIRNVFGYGWEGVAVLGVTLMVLVGVAIPRLSESRLSWRFPKQRLVLIVRTSYALALMTLVAGGGFLVLGLVAMVMLVLSASLRARSIRIGKDAMKCPRASGACRAASVMA